MSANLSGNNIDSGDFMIKTSVADPEGGYAKEKFHADPRNGVIISEVDGPKGKCLEFSADWSVVSLNTMLEEGANIDISEDQQTGKLEISAPDVGKVLVDNNDTNFKYLDSALASSDSSVSHSVSSGQVNLTVPDLGKVKFNGSLKDLTDGEGIKLVESGTTLAIQADLLNGTGISIVNNVGGSKTISNTAVGLVKTRAEDTVLDYFPQKLVFGHNFATSINSSTNKYRIDYEGAIVSRCETATYKATATDGYYKIKGALASVMDNYIKLTTYQDEVYTLVSFRDIMGLGSRGSNCAVRIYYSYEYNLGDPSVSVTKNYRCEGRILSVSNGSPEIYTFSKNFQISFEESGSGYKYGYVEIPSLEPSGGDFMVLSGDIFEKSDEVETDNDNNYLSILGVEFVHYGYDISEGDISV